MMDQDKSKSFFNHTQIQRNTQILSKSQKWPNVPVLLCCHFTNYRFSPALFLLSSRKDLRYLRLELSLFSDYIQSREKSLLSFSKLFNISPDTIVSLFEQPLTESSHSSTLWAFFSIAGEINQTLINYIIPGGLWLGALTDIAGRPIIL